MKKPTRQKYLNSRVFPKNNTSFTDAVSLAEGIPKVLHCIEVAMMLQSLKVKID